jgi:tRNA pseudouridine32 synthase/23S rRNA pseudouridine746 synthase/23S rRNA pseudouridine1911/1915/1917 synthase
MTAKTQNESDDTVNAPATIAPPAAALLDRVLYRDGLMLVIDKPAGIKVHATAGGGAALDAAFDVLRFGLPRAPALAHRLDRDTSGCLVLGRHPKALRRLGRLFAEGRIDKTYWAVVEGAPSNEAGRVDAPLSNRGGVMHVDRAGQAAVTDYRVLGRSGGLAWLELRPLTGRMHQLRVHCASLGCPILGDARYGAKTGARPMHLHARAIAIPLYPKRPAIAVTAPVPAPMRAALAACGFAGD